MTPDDAVDHVREVAGRFARSESSVVTVGSALHASLHDLCALAPLSGDFLDLFDAIEHWEVAVGDERGRGRRERPGDLPPAGRGPVVEGRATCHESCGTPAAIRVTRASCEDRQPHDEDERVASGTGGRADVAILLNPWNPPKVDDERLGEVCERFGVSRLEVFGSVSRGDPAAESDIDLLYDLAPNARLGWEIEALAEELASLLGRRVDLVSRAALNVRLRDSVLAEAQLLYAA